MAIKKSTPKPRPGATSSTANPTGRGSRKGTKVRVITGVTRPFKKATVRNPNAPKSIGSGAAPGSVRVITSTEGAMKRDKAGRNRSGISKNNRDSSGKSPKVGGFSLKPDSTRYGSASRGSERFQKIKGTSFGYGMSANDVKARDAMMRGIAGDKGSKPSKVTPKKKAEAPKKAAPKRRLFVGRGGGGRGGMLAGGLNDLNK